MREGEGTRATATINGQGTEDFSTRLNEGDDISLTNGSDITEEYTIGEPSSPPTHPSQQQRHWRGSSVHPKGRTGRKSSAHGQRVRTNSSRLPPKSLLTASYKYHNVNTNGDKVIARTFDDGPWDT